MTTHHATVALVMALAFAGAASARAQQAGAPARCTGLLCDVYYGTRPANAPEEPGLPCNDFVCRAFSHGPAAQPAIAPPQAAILEAPTTKTIRRKHKSKVVAKMVPAQSAAAAIPN